MSVLTWQNVAAPDFRGTMTGMAISSEALNRSFSGLSDALGKFDTYRKDAALADILRQTSAIQDPNMLRPTVASNDLSNLGPAQFAALEAALSGRVDQGDKLQTFNHRGVMYPIEQKGAQLKLDDMGERLPLERNLIRGQAAQAFAGAAASSANTAATRNRDIRAEELHPLQLEEARLKGKISQETYERGVKEYGDNQQTETMWGQITAGIGPDVVGDLTRRIESVRGTTSPTVYAKLQDRARQYGAYGGLPGSPSGSGTGGRGVAATPPAAAPSLAPLEPTPGTEAVADNVNAALRRVSTVSSLVNQDIADTDRKRGASIFVAAQKDNTPEEQVIKEFIGGKDSPYSKLEVDKIKNALADIRAAASKGKDGVTLTPRATAAILSRNFDFQNSVLPNGTPLLGPSGTNPRLLWDGINADVQALKSGTVTNASRASAALQTSMREIESSQAQALKTARDYQAAIQASLSNPNISLEPYKKKAETAAARVDTQLKKFVEENPRLFPVAPRAEGQRMPPGLTMATPEDTSGTNPSAETRRGWLRNWWNSRRERDSQ
jgi:hypothetical protein